MPPFGPQPQQVMQPGAGALVMLQAWVAPNALDSKTTIPSAATLIFQVIDFIAASR